MGVSDLICVRCDGNNKDFMYGTRAVKDAGDKCNRGDVNEYNK